VVATALDARDAGFEVRVLLGLTAGVLKSTTEAAIERMREAAVELAGSTLEP
jgi:nicotinamidase/pyrazinamidase